MNESDKFDLLQDLARLIKKYGPDAFVSLSEFLKTPTAIDQLVTILDASSTAGQNARVTKSSRNPNKHREELSEILAAVQNTDPHKAQEISAFIRAFGAKRALPNLRDIRDFASDNGLKPVTATSRDKALRPLVKDLISRSSEELSTILKKIALHDLEGDRTLEGWAGVILDKGRRNR